MGAILRLRSAAVILLAAMQILVTAAARGEEQPGPTAGATVSQLDVALGVRVEALADEVAELADRIELEADDDGELLAIRLRLEEIGADLTRQRGLLEARIAAIRARLDEIGPTPPADAPPEPDALVEERAELTRERAELTARLGVAATLEQRIAKLVDRVAELRRTIFADNLSKRYPLSLIFEPGLAEAMVTETRRLFSLVFSWVARNLAERLSEVVVATIASLAIAAGLSMFLRRLVLPLLTPDPANTEPSYLSRLTVAFWSTLIPVLALLVFLASGYLLYQLFGILDDADIARLLQTAAWIVAIVFFIHRLSGALLMPRLPDWRLVPVHDAAAAKLLWLLSAITVVTVFDFLSATVFAILNSPIGVVVALHVASNILVGILIILVARLEVATDPGGAPRQWPALLRAMLHLVGFGTIVVTLLGYVGLASFISRQIVITGGIVTMIYLGFKSAGVIISEGAFQQTALGRRIGAFLGLKASSIDWLGLILGLLLYPLILALGVPLILLTWGFQPGDIQSLALRLTSPVTIGDVSISIIGIVGGILFFALGFLITRWVQRWADATVLSRSGVDPGVRNSVRLTIGYAGIALAALIGVSAAGIDLTSLALVAGALSLGIGFGLQNIVSNFVSGLILLAERPFKVGDWIIAGNVEGTVKRINVRATEIETSRRQTVIMPNSVLINQPVSNWTHRSKLGRVDLDVKVSFESDVHKVREVLLQLAREHPQVIRTPEPVVDLVNMGGGGLDFVLRMYLSDITASGRVQNEIRMAIIDAFAREGIVIP